MPIIIAEYCQNHNGDIEILKRMVESSARAGATHGKIQTISASNLTFRPEFENGCEKDGITYAIKRPFKDEFDRLKGLELTDEETEEFIRVCNDNGIVPMTTCFVRSDVKRLQQIGFKKIKVASYDCASFKLLSELKENFEEIIVSTGASYDDEISYASEILDGANFSFLHCVTLYPTPLDQMHLSRIDFLKQFTDKVGFSDHSLISELGVLGSKIALAIGADIIERHYTILDSSETKDGPVSINDKLLMELSEFSKLEGTEQKNILNKEFPNWEVALGNKLRKLSHTEILNRNYYRGRFASKRPGYDNNTNMIFNWDIVNVS